jgi:uncharacterized protein (DUF4415 family)
MGTSETLAPQTAQLMRDIEEGFAAVASGRGLVVHTPEQILARKRGRPIGSTQAATKARVTITLDADVLAALRASGKGWQTRLRNMVRSQVLT